MFGTLPANGFFSRHVNNIRVREHRGRHGEAGLRPTFWLENVRRADSFRVKASKVQGASVFNLKGVKDFRVFGSRVVRDAIFEDVNESRSNSLRFRWTFVMF